VSAPLAPTEVVERLVESARRAGADAADAIASDSDGIEVKVRMGEPEKLTRARERRAGLRVFVGGATAIVSSADLTAAALARLADDAYALARVTAPDPHGGLPDPADVAADVPDLDLHDPAAAHLDADEGFRTCEAAERAALDADPAITNSEGAEWSAGGGSLAYATSQGFVGSYATSSFALSVVPVATQDGTMQRDSWWTADRWRARLDEPASVGREAARRAARRLGARRVPTGAYPVVFDPLAAASLLRHVAGAIAGPTLYRRASFLLGHLNEAIASPIVTIVDDPTRPRGPASKPFDGEGVATRRRTIVEGGLLRSYLLDSYSARRLDLASTGHAARAVGDAPTVAPTNFTLEAGAESPEDVIASVDRGLYVTELIGFGVNLVTGDYSRGAAGLWIEGGELTHAVEEITIAGNLRTMLTGISRIANDLDRRRATAAPTVRIDGLTIAGA
jgi:PmbA protein